jgi:hypothetical protein
MEKTKIALTSLGILLLPVLAFAQPTVQLGSLQQVINNIERAVWIVFGLIAVICFVYAAILFLSAGGQPEKIQAARSAFIWGIAGVAVGIIAYSIIAVVSSVMGGGA